MMSKERAAKVAAYANGKIGQQELVAYLRGQDFREPEPIPTYKYGTKESDKRYNEARDAGHGLRRHLRRGRERADQARCWCQ
jgi:hypothetical protein